MKKQIDPFDAIKLELLLYKTNFIVDFMNMFPTKHKNYFIPLQKKFLVKYRQAGMTTLNNYRDITLYVTCSSSQDFWQRWDRFKKLKAFL